MKKLSFFLMAMLFSVMSFAAETVAYTLTTAKTGTGGDNSAYASAVDYTANDITWNVTGNSEMVPWRIGGKSLDKVDRAVYTKTALAADVTKIEITHAIVNLTCNSCSLTVSDAANGEGETFPVTVTQNTTTTITLPEGDYSNKFYKLVYNVTNSATSNKYVQLQEIKFYTEVQTSVEAPTFTPEEGKVAANNTFAEPFALTIASATEGATIKYTLDGTDPALETALTYEAPITISTMVQVRAIAVKGEESSVEATATYIVASTEEKPYTASEAITAQSLGLAASVYVTGTVKTIEEISTQYGNATYNITDGVKELKIYRGKNLENAKFTSEDQLLVGDVVVVKGDLTSYNGAAQLGQNNYLISRIPAVVNHTITVAANPAEAGTVTGGGEYEQGDTATLNATAAEGYEFTCWTEGTDTVATTAEYAFEVLANRNLVANFEEVEQTPSYETVELTMTNLDVDDDFTTFVGSETMYGVSVSLLPDLTKPIEGMYMTYGLKAGSTLTFSGQNLEIVDGYMTIEMGMTTTVYAVVLAKFGEEQYMFSITMTEPAETQEITETDATITYEFGALKFLVELEDEDFVSVEVAGFKYPGNVTDQLVEGQQIATFENAAAFAIANKVYVTVTNDTLVEVYGEYTSNFGATYNVTISGVLPVYTVAVTAENGTVTGAGTYIAAQEATLVATAAEGYEFVNWTVNGKEESDEATYTFLAEANIELVANFKEAAKPTISYELNGGAFPTVAVPAAAELLMAFKVDYLAAFNITDATDSDMNVREAGNFIYVMNSKGGDAVKFITENANWKWLHDYILSVAGNIPEGTNVSFYWRANIDGFFHCKNAVAVGGVASADYTEAGKPEVWGAAYQAAKGIVLPTEPVAEAYTLPTPTKEGSVFQGWYDNAEGQGEAMTVIPAGWYGTLYAIWTVEGGTTTGLDNAPVVMDVVKVIKNGQLVIIRNGVEYNANGAILK